MNKNHNKDPVISAYITNLGKYNEGEFVGKWHDFPTTHEEIKETFKEIGIDGKQYEEYFITDYESSINGITDDLPEYINLDELNYLASVLNEIDTYDIEKYSSALELEGTHNLYLMINLTNNLDNYSLLDNVHDDYGLGYYWLEESGCYDLKSMERLENYSDYERFGRDVRFDEVGTYTDNGYIYACGEPFVEIYDGYVPDEYRVLSTENDIEINISSDYSNKNDMEL